MKFFFVKYLCKKDHKRWSVILSQKIKKKKKKKSRTKKVSLMELQRYKKLLAYMYYVCQEGNKFEIFFSFFFWLLKKTKG